MSSIHYRTTKIHHRATVSPLKGRKSPIKGRVDARMSTLKHRLPRISKSSSRRRSARRLSASRRSTRTGITKIRRTVAGASNVGKYFKSEGPFCGSEAGTFPVNTRKRIRSALAYRRDDPNPKHVKKCACKQAKKKGYNFPSCGVKGTKMSIRRRSSSRK
jgi:hypothetical protein